VTCWTLNSRCLTVFRNPYNATCPVAFGAFGLIADVSYVLVSPFFLLSAKIFFPVFFLNVQVVRTEDLHLLQFFTIPALNIHKVIYLLIVILEKIQLFDRFSPEDKRNSSLRSMQPH